MGRRGGGRGRPGPRQGRRLQVRPSRGCAGVGMNGEGGADHLMVDWVSPCRAAVCYALCVCTDRGGGLGGSMVLDRLLCLLAFLPVPTLPPPPPNRHTPSTNPTSRAHRCPASHKLSNPIQSDPLAPTNDHDHRLEEFLPAMPDKELGKAWDAIATRLAPLIELLVTSSSSSSGACGWVGGWVGAPVFFFPFLFALPPMQSTYMHLCTWR